MTVRSCVLLGAGGHARVVIDALRAADGPAIHGILDNDAKLWETNLDGVPVLGGDMLLPDMVADGIEGFAVAVGMTRPGPLRRQLFDAAVKAGLTAVTVCHPSAIVSPRATLEDGCQLFAGAIVNPGAVVAANAIINSGAIIEHDCHIGAHVHVATGATLGGNVAVAPGAHIGLGATVRQGIRIGGDALVGAGAMVIGNVDPNTTVIGIPARPAATP